MMRKTAVALYHNLEPARKAMRVLVDQGFNYRYFSLLTPDGTGEYVQQFGPYQPSSGRSPLLEVEDYARIWSARVGLGGLCAGLGVLTIPGLGPVLAAGPLAAAASRLASAEMGEAAGGPDSGLLQALVDLEIPEEYAALYVEGVRRGNTLLVVSVPALRGRDALGILSRFDPLDVDQRAREWLEDSPIQSDHTDRIARFLRGYSQYDQAFRAHFYASPLARLYQYEDCEPAYRYGYNLGRSRRSRGREWSEIEPEARQAWETRYPGTWNRFKNSIRHAWKLSSRVQ